MVAEIIVEDRAKAAKALYKQLKVDTTPSVSDNEKSNVVLENIRISYPGHGTEEDARRVVAEDENRYLEQYFFGVLPAGGAYIRHA